MCQHGSGTVRVRGQRQGVKGDGNNEREVSTKGSPRKVQRKFRRSDGQMK